LGRLEVLRRLAYHKPPISPEHVQTELVRYVTAYWGMPSTPDDLIPYLKLVTPDQAEALAAALDAVVTQAGVDGLSRLRLELTVGKINRLLGRVREATPLLASYLQAIDLEDPPKKGEHRKCDEFILLAVDTLPPPAVPTALAQLEFASEKSPYNFDLKLKLIQLYKSVAAYSAVLDIYNTLDIKAVQHESVEWMLLQFFANNKIFVDKMETSVNAVFKFHRISEVELRDTSFKSFLNYNLRQTVDFLKFSYTLENSYSFHVCQFLDLHARFMRHTLFGVTDTSNYRVLSAIIAKPLDTYTMNGDFDLEYFCGELELGSPVELDAPHFSHKESLRDTAYFGVYT
jgi:N-terminal acetyltransferase B complex non-catalytic subunit